MNPNTTLLLGAVAYDPKVVDIWDGFQRYFARHNLNFDYVLYTNYERQVEALFAGQVHVAWNSPLAWLQCERIAGALGRKADAICMRDTDCDLTSVIYVKSDSGINGLADLRGKRIAVGAADSPQATLIPLNFLAEQGVDGLQVTRFDVLSGKHGDHIGGERDAARALMRGEVAAACCINGNHLLFTQEATLPAGATRVIATTPVYDHCNFTILDTASNPQMAQFRELLLGMSYGGSCSETAARYGRPQAVANGPHRRLCRSRCSAATLRYGR